MKAHTQLMPGGLGAGANSRSQESFFFFEKKKQKSFVC